MAFESMNLFPATSPDAIFSASYCITPEDIILLRRAAHPPLVRRVPNLRNNIFFAEEARCLYRTLWDRNLENPLFFPQAGSLSIAFSIAVQGQWEEPPEVVNAS
jgi:hypothetical protein